MEANVVTPPAAGWDVAAGRPAAQGKTKAAQL